MKKITMIGMVIASVMLSPFVYATTQSPAHYTLNDNDTTQIVLSSVDMNRVMIEGDTISAIHCPTGFCITGKTDGNGGALLSLANGVPFTLFLDTTKGRHIGVLVLPASTAGKTISLHVDATEDEALDSIEHSAGYDARYVEIMKAVLKAYDHNQTLKGYSIKHYSTKEQKKQLKKYGVIQSQPLVQYESSHYIATLYLLSNHSLATVPLSPAMFHQKGMPALSLASDRVKGEHISTLVTLREK
ncbi:hypothetical protein HC723_10960 [Vibrio sp. S11_S32]|uniref:TraK domain-containing protein n=1 Tax=Vibrio sp. S11_S32 TaxID=2720225 RepID=UPI0016815EBB|nr:type-F conjugative transfer system secretin TraK [Vibrio sp. S11_S32]MBD1576948.1 hypothetical protein [Vibrio sp. S11_S32]